MNVLRYTLRYETNGTRDLKKILFHRKKCERIKGFSHVITAELAEKRMEDEQLIEAVREFPCLWQVSSRAYKDLRAKENAWKEISQVFV